MSPQDRLSRIRTVLQKEIDADRMPGAVVMIARRGQLIYSEAIGFQDKAAGRAAITKDAIFRIYSMTKPLASVAAMMLVRGRQDAAHRSGGQIPAAFRQNGSCCRPARTARPPER